MNKQYFNRERSTSTLANTISFTHARQSQSNDDGESDDEQLRSPILTHSSTNKSSNDSPFFYTNKNNSSSTLHSITHTLSNVGFTSVLPNSANSNNSDSESTSPAASHSNVTSPTIGKMENALNRAKIYAKTKTKELQKRTKNDLEKSYHHQHHNFLKKTGHSGLSSSSSTSKVLDSGNTLYSFDPVLQVSDNDSLMRQITNETHLKSMSFEEKDTLADEIWSNIVLAVSPIFKVDRGHDNFIKTPIEDLNHLMEIYIRLRVENDAPASSIIGEIQEFLRNGFGILENELSFQEDIDRSVYYRVIITWEYFINRIYFYLLGIIAPLELEFKGTGPILKSFPNYWSDTVDIGTFSSTPQLSTMKLLICSFREFILLPYFDSNIDIPTELKKDELITLTQCFGMVKSVQSCNYSQRIIDHILNLLLKAQPCD